MSFSPDNFEIVCCSSDRDRWLKERRGGITSSDAPCLLGEGYNHRGPAEVWASKVNVPDEPMEGELEPEHFFWGHELEPVAIEAYGSERYTGRPTHHDGLLLRSRRWPFLMCTMDGRTIPFTPGTGPHDVGYRWQESADAAPLEIKNVSSFAADSWANGAPRRHRIQLHAQMLVTGARVASIAALIGGNQLAWEDVPFDPALAARLLKRAERLWGHVQRNEMPLDNTVSGERVLRRVYPDHVPASEVALDHWAVEMDEQYVDANEQIAAANKAKQEAKTALLRGIGKHERAVLPNGVVWTAKTNRKGSRVMRRKEAS